MLTKKQVSNRIAKAIKKHEEQRRYGKALSLKFYSRSTLFKASNLDFNPLTGLGHSYDWYEITKMINGQLVLNSYNYSATTIKHVSKLRSLLNALNLKYVEVEAPNGLQNLDAAANHTVLNYAKILIQNKYAKKPNESSERYLEQQLDLIRSLGGKASIKLKQALEAAEQDRKTRLEIQRMNRAVGIIWE